NWAISSSALIATLAFGRGDVSHVAFPFLMSLLFFFLHLESRRFRHYETSRHRALVLEQLLLPEVTGEPLDAAQGEALCRSLTALPPRVSILGNMGWRLRRTYLWIYSAVLVAWLAKLEMSGEPSASLSALVGRAQVGSFPGWLTVVVVVASYLWLLYLAL